MAGSAVRPFTLSQLAPAVELRCLTAYVRAPTAVAPTCQITAEAPARVQRIEERRLTTAKNADLFGGFDDGLGRPAFDNSTTLAKRDVCTVYGTAISS